MYTTCINWDLQNPLRYRWSSVHFKFQADFNVGYVRFRQDKMTSGVQWGYRKTNCTKCYLSTLIVPCEAVPEKQKQNKKHLQTKPKTENTRRQ